MKHTIFILAVWCVFCSWVVLACRTAYLSTDGLAVTETVAVPTRFGLPSWVFWGIALPWGVASALTILYALFGIREEPNDGV